MDEGADENYTQDNFGALFHDATPKPLFAATAYLVRLLGKAEFAKDLTTDRDKCRMLEFRLGDGTPVLAAWTLRGEVPASLPEGFAVAECRDIMGNVIATPLDQAGTLRLSDSSTYLIGAN